MEPWLAPKLSCHSHVNAHTALRNSTAHSRQLLGCSLDVAVEEVDLRSQHVGEACSAFVGVVMAAGAAEQFGPRCLAGDFERGRDVAGPGQANLFSLIGR